MEKRKNNCGSILFVSAVTSFITTFMGSAVNLSVPEIEKDLGVSAAAVGWIITVYMLTCAALAVPFGKIADTLSKKNILVGGIFLFALSSVAASFVSSFVKLIIARICQGAGASMIFSTNMAIITETFSADERGRVFGYTTGANFLGLSAGPPLGGLLTEYFGWQAVFTAAGIVSSVVFIIAAGKLPMDKRSKDMPAMDVKGGFMYITAIIAFMYGLSLAVSSFLGVILMAGGLMLFIFFVATEKKARQPLLDVKAFYSNKPYFYSNLNALINYGSNFAVSYLMALYLQVIQEENSKTAGLIMVSLPLTMSVVSLVIGRLSDKHPPYILSAMGTGVCTAVLCIFAMFGSNTDIKVILTLLIVFGTGLALFASPNTNAVMTSAGKENYSVASSILSTARSFGHSASMAIVTAVVSLKMGGENLYSADKTAFAEVFRISFLIFALLSIMGIFMALRSKS